MTDMQKIEFSVGAKAARLIGRENIADVDGALIELIKNVKCYTNVVTGVANKI